MAFTYSKLAEVTLGSSAAFIELNNIPQNYNDICVLYSLRGNTIQGVYLQFNSSTNNFTGIYLYSDATNVSSASLARYAGSINNSASTFTNGCLYIPNYAGTNNKSFSIDEVYDQPTSAGNLNFISGLWSSPSAISSIKIEAANSLTQNSTIYLYGVKAEV